MLIDDLAIKLHLSFVEDLMLTLMETKWGVYVPLSQNSIDEIKSHYASIPQLIEAFYMEAYYRSLTKWHIDATT